MPLSLILILLLVGFSYILTPSHVKALDPPVFDYIVDGDTVYIDHTKFYLGVSPHTLSSSGWVTFEFELKQSISDTIDIFWGFNIPNSKPVVAQRWMSYVHPKQYYGTRDDIGVKTFYHVTNYENLGIENYDSYTVDYGNRNNSKLWRVYSDDGVKIIAFDTQVNDGVNLTCDYIYSRTGTYWVDEDYYDWKNWNPDFKKINYDAYDMNTWYLMEDLNPQVGVTYKVRCYVETPINSDGKYCYGVKAHSLSFQEAINQNKFYIIDPWWNNNWQYKKAIVIDHNQVLGALTNYPVCINITDTDLRDDAQNDGDDIVFVDSTETLQFAYDLEYFNGATGHLVAWVNVSSLSAIADTTIYMYYGNPGATEQKDVVGTWDTTIYYGVWHYNETSGDADDCTKGNHNGTNHGAVQGTTCQLDGGYTFTDDYVDYNYPFNRGSNDFSLMIYGTKDNWGDSSTDYLIANYDGTAGKGWYGLLETSTDVMRFRWDDGAALTDVDFPSGGLSTTRYYLFTGVRDVGNDNFIYLDGTLKSNKGSDSGNACTCEHEVWVGEQYGEGNVWDGKIDEVRIYKVALNTITGYIGTTFNNFNNATDGGFFALGPEIASGNHCPEFTNPLPVNQTKQLDIKPRITITVTDQDGDTFNVTWYSNMSGSWQPIGTNLSVTNGTFSQILNFDGNFERAWWNVSADDGQPANHSNESGIYWLKTHEWIFEPTSFNADYFNETAINLTWVKGVNGTTNHIRRAEKTVPPTTLATGTLIYNNTAILFDDTGLNPGSEYNYSVWGFNDQGGYGYHFSRNYTSAGNYTLPDNPQNVTGLLDLAADLNMTWDNGTGHDSIVIIRKNGGYPTNPGDGTEIYNGTANNYTDAAYADGLFYTLYGYNDTSKLYSTGVQLLWGGLVINVYDENTTLDIAAWDLHIENFVAGTAYEATGCNNPTSVDIATVPHGTYTKIMVSKTGYNPRIYYVDLDINEQYNLNLYLAPIDLSELYLFTVKDVYGTGLNNVEVSIYRSIGGIFVNISKLYTGNTGKFQVYLMTDTLYNFIFNKTGFEISYEDYTTSNSIFTDEFIMQYLHHDITPDENIWNNITWSITPSQGRYTTNITLNFTITSTDNELEWWNASVWYYNTTTGNWTLLSYHNCTNAGGGTWENLTPNWTGQYRFLCVFKKTNYTMYYFGGENGYIYWIYTPKYIVEEDVFPPDVWLAITIAIMMVGMASLAMFGAGDMCAMGGITIMGIMFALYPSGALVFAGISCWFILLICIIAYGAIIMIRKV